MLSSAYFKSLLFAQGFVSPLLHLQTGNAEEIAKYSKRTTRVTAQHNEECKKLLELMGVPIVTVWLQVQEVVKAHESQD